ncbi:hypothetical protein F0365_11695 [Nonlabens sp. Ci31]|uniref:hypothetical protein n=1 Tax=Nonlabens sp. Ci31 TaxID=2608253 RepID=UPI001463B8D1|nr:hypothetical protein [Nonlabens sp. Ci31]QJP35001.1 hypothetical protein F0365_11695 [Nonlabens sp. Ci31]
MKIINLYILASFLMFLSCTIDELVAEDDNQNTVSALYKYIGCHLDVSTNPPTELDSTVYDVIDNKIEVMSTYYSNASKESSPFNYVSQHLFTIIYFEDAIPKCRREDFSYDSAGYLSERLSTRGSDFLKYNLKRIQDTTYINLETSTTGMTYISIPSNPLFKVVTNQNDQVTYVETRDDINGFTRKTNYNV